MAVALVVVFLAGPVLGIGRHVPLNYDEGWNAYLALRAIGLDSAPLYPPPGGLAFNNYPPLSFFLVGALGRALGDMIVAGRVIALAGLLASAALLAFCVRRLGASRVAAAVGGVLLLLFATTFCRDYVAMDDPQWLGHALMLGGLAVLLRRGTEGIGIAPAILAAVLMLLGGFVKHNLVALPLAAAVWLLMTRPAAGLAFVGAAAVGLGVGIAVTLGLWGADAWADIVHTPRAYGFAGVLKGMGRLEPLVPMAGIAIWGLAGRWREDGVRFVGVFGAIALVTGIAQRAGEGVAINAMFETLIAVCGAFALALDRPRQAMLVALACVPVLVVLPQRVGHAWGDLVEARAREAAWRPVIARLAASPAPVACEMLSLCYWAGQRFTLDLFNLTEAIRAGERVPDLSEVKAFEYQRSTIPKILVWPGLHPVLHGPDSSVVQSR